MIMKTGEHNRPIGITMGCPAGIGPEIILKYYAHAGFTEQPKSIVIGDIHTLLQTGRMLNLPVPIHQWIPGSIPEPGKINVLDPGDTDLGGLVPGQPNKETGLAMVSYIERAISLCREHHIAGMATCPISKTTLNEAGYHFPGHTEMLAKHTGSDRAVMMMAGRKLKITLATIHCALDSVSSLLSMSSLESLISLTHRALQVDFKIDRPKIAVAGLNPHAGEGGLFGDEETRIIKPAIRRMHGAALDVTGPYPPDTIFYKAAAGNFDVVVCMYHDQGLIPFKLLHFSDGVNVTLGLPIVRTSVDHGTAYDIAGTGRADHQSLKAAVEMGIMIADNRTKDSHQV